MLKTKRYFQQLIHINKPVFRGKMQILIKLMDLINHDFIIIWLEKLRKTIDRYTAQKCPVSRIYNKEINNYKTKNNSQEN